MKINKAILATMLFTSVSMSYAETSDSVKLVKLEQSLQKEIKTREALSQELNIQKAIITNQTKVIDSLCYNVEQNAKNIKTTADEIGVKIDETNTSLGAKADTTDVTTTTLLGGVLLLLVAVLAIVIYVLLHKKINKGTADVNELRAKAEKLNEEVLNQFAQEMSEMQKISSSLDAIAKNPAQADSGKTLEPDHSLIKTLADRITFMEMTLFKMDPKVKGFKQLSKSISQMKDNLLANGYELVEMLGKPYNDGMKAVANFNDDEEIEEGKRIITAIIKPQINYKGEMIQAAQITVSQNIQ